LYFKAIEMQSKERGNDPLRLRICNISPLLT